CTKSERRIMLAAPGNPLLIRFQGSCLSVLPFIALGHGFRLIPVANADYVPRPSRGKVTNVLFVPDVLPSALRVFSCKFVRYESLCRRLRITRMSWNISS